MSGLRVISGQLRGRRLEAPADCGTRPTADRLRERIFSILKSRNGAFEGLKVADIFAGSGAMGIEAVSRGAAMACFVENDSGSLELLKRNLKKLKIDGLCEVLAADARRLPASGGTFDLIFLDPPYGHGLVEPALISLAESKWIGRDSLLIVELAAADPFDLPSGFVAVDDRQHGSSRIMFLTLAQ